LWKRAEKFKAQCCKKKKKEEGKEGGKKEGE
jgi:hypothetical protein